MGIARVLHGTPAEEIAENLRIKESGILSQKESGKDNPKGSLFRSYL